MEYSLQQRAELIITACMEICDTNPYEIFHAIAREDYVRLHGPEHHVLDGACILTAFRNAGGNIDLRTALQKLMAERPVHWNALPVSRSGIMRRWAGSGRLPVLRRANVKLNYERQNNAVTI